MSGSYSKKEREELIDKLLIDINDKIEGGGHRLSHLMFSFFEKDEDTLKFLEKHKIAYDQFESVVKVCISRNYLENCGMGYGLFGGIVLTEEGQARAISAQNADSNRVATGGDINIGTLNTNAPTQIGNYNQQDIQNLVQYLFDKIDSTDAISEKKQEAKGHLQAFLEHPLTQTAIGTATTIGTSLLVK